MLIEGKVTLALLMTGQHKLITEGIVAGIIPEVNIGPVAMIITPLMFQPDMTTHTDLITAGMTSVEMIPSPSI